MRPIDGITARFLSPKEKREIENGIARTIDGNALLFVFAKRRNEQKGIYISLVEAENIIRETPTIDAVEQKHGHWQIVKECEAYFNECSNCKCRLWEVEPEWIFCPYCACKMDEVTE